MKQEQSNPVVHLENSGYQNASPIPMLACLKALLEDGWFALGNVLLLIGGDDSVDLRFRPFTLQVLHRPSIQLSAERNEAHSA